MYKSMLSGPQATLTDEYTSGLDATIHISNMGVLPIVSANEENYLLVVAPDYSAAVCLAYTAMHSTSTEFIVDIAGVVDSYPATAMSGYNFTVGSFVSRPILPADIYAIQNNIEDILATMAAADIGVATSLREPQSFEGVSFNGTAPVSHYAVCSTPAYTAAKSITLSNFGLVTGARIIVQFTEANKEALPTLNVSNTGTYPIMWMGSSVDATALNASTIYEMVFTGNSWAIVGDIIAPPSQITIHGFLLDNSDSNPETRITYVGASANLSAEERMALYTQHNRHCVMKAAQVVGFCDETDWSKFEDGSDSGVASGFSLDGNFCMRHDTLWWRISQYTSDVGLVEFTWDNPHDSSWVSAHAYGDGTIRTELFTGVFEATNGTVNDVANCLRSVYGTDTSFKPLVNINNEVAYARAQNAGTADGLTGDTNTYSHEQAITYAMCWMQWIWAYGTTDFQSDVARGIVDDSNSVIGARPCGYGMSLTGGMTQGTPATSQSYTNNVAAVYGGRVNPHGNVWEHKADCVYKYGRFAMAVMGGDHLNITTVTAANFDTTVPDSWHIATGLALSSGYVKAITFDRYFFGLPATVGGAATTYMADYTYRNSADTSEAAAAARCCFIGGGWSNGSLAGPGFVDLIDAVGGSGGTIGARLQAHGLTPVRT